MCYPCYLADRRRARDRLTADHASNAPPTNAVTALTLRGIDRSFRVPPGSARLQTSRWPSLPQTNISRIDQATVRACTGSKSVRSSKTPGVSYSFRCRHLSTHPPGRLARQPTPLDYIFRAGLSSGKSGSGARIPSARQGLHPSCFLGLMAYILGAGLGTPMLRAFGPSSDIREPGRRRRQAHPEFMHFIQVLRPWDACETPCVVAGFA